MKTQLITLAVVLTAAVCGCAEPTPRQKAEKEAQIKAQALLEQLTPDEKTSLLLYTSPAIERLGIRSYNWWNEEEEDMLPLRGAYKLLYGSDSQHVKALDYKY